MKSRILFLAKFSLKNETEIKTSQAKQKLKEFNTSAPALKNVLKKSSVSNERTCVHAQ